MSGRYAKLNKDWMLRGWNDLPSTLVNWRTDDHRQLNQTGFYVAESCDGRTDFDSFAFLPKHHAMLDLLVTEGIVQHCPEGDAIEPWQRHRKADNPRLKGIHWCVTGLCNLNCRHCYMEAPSGRYGELPFNAMAGLVEQFERANVIEVSFTGGEPFLRKDLLQIIRLLAKKKIRLVQIYSNGLLISDRHLESIRKIGFRPSFQISFDGVGTHDQMRGTKGTEPGVVDAIGRLRAAGFPVVISTCIDKLNIGSLTDTYELMKRLDVQGWRVSAPQETGNWRGTTTAASLHDQAKVCTPLLEHWIKDCQPFSIQLGGLYHGGGLSKPQTDPAGRPAGANRARRRSREGYMGLKRPAEMSGTPAYTPDAYDCGTCREQPNLLPDGTLVPCPGYVDTALQDRMPNLLREDLSKVWTSSFLRQIADIRKKDVLAKNPQCANCELFFTACGGGCRASALTETGNLMSRDPITCDLFKKGFKKRFREMATAAR